MYEGCLPRLSAADLRARRVAALEAQRVQAAAQPAGQQAEHAVADKPADGSGRKKQAAPAAEKPLEPSAREPDLLNAASMNVGRLVVVFFGLPHHTSKASPRRKKERQISGIFKSRSHDRKCSAIKC